MALLSLLVMAVGMFIGTVIVGQLPLMVKMSQAKQKALSLYGIGLLLGAALSVVIPEGIETLYDAATEQSRAVALSLVAGFLFMFLVDELQSHAHLHHKSPETSETAFDFKERSHNFILARRLSARHSPTDCERSPRTSTDGPGIDSPLLSAARKALTGPNAPHLPSGLERGHSAPLLQPEERLPSNARSSYDDKLTVHAGQRGSSISTTIGLLVHSLADGISLGASAAVSANTKGDSSAVSLDVIVFLAIMVHKAPAAFGLATVLLGDGWPRNRIRLTLTAFAATAPMGAVLTFFLLKLVSHVTGGANETESMKYWTGIALLFSGGTFLFVATHIMQEADSPVAEEGERPTSKWLKPSLMVGGMLTPLLLQAVVGGHSH